MLNHILQHYQDCDYDFRVNACADDPLIALFEDWVDYYRMKWAIAKELKPKSIVEIGVRYGYSARAFLEACPNAKYLGIDADVPVFGGHPGALAWAQNNLSSFNVEFLRENTQLITSLPGELYDLAHVDGQQDGEGTFHDLDLASRRAVYILVDGYFWTRDNFLATNEWLWLNKATIEWTMVIPSYAGECLIKTIQDHASYAELHPTTSLPLAGYYSTAYYLQDCGGYIQWRQNKGKELIDARLRAMADISLSFGRPGKVVDLGAGRGELTHFFAQQGAQVTAVDYSKSAADLIEQSLEGSCEAIQHVKVICDSVLNPSIYDEMYDLALASDLIEHLSPDEVEKLYSLLSERLRPTGGVLVIHTAPNCWRYRYEHPRQQRAAKMAGCWLPRVRRTWYERILHINEQSPNVLKKQISRHFPHVLIWFASDKELGGSLLKPFSISDMRRSPSLFAVASHREIDKDRIIAVFCLPPLTESEADKISLSVLDSPAMVQTEEIFNASVVLKNKSDRMLLSCGPNPMHLSYHWSDKTGKHIVYDGLRTPLNQPLPGHSQSTYDVRIKAPDKPGLYRLRVVPVQEMVRWYENANPGDEPIIAVENEHGRKQFLET
jgi:2-polyprenyl-3-methyl-5-hydroxy-6-metoxy-1,4-benzoquinol methylase